MRRSLDWFAPKNKVRGGGRVLKAGVQRPATATSLACSSQTQRGVSPLRPAVRREATAAQLVGGKGAEKWRAEAGGGGKCPNHVGHMHAPKKHIPTTQHSSAGITRPAPWSFRRTGFRTGDWQCCWCGCVNTGGHLGTPSLSSATAGGSMAVAAAVAAAPAGAVSRICASCRRPRGPPTDVPVIGQWYCLKCGSWSVAPQTAKLAEAMLKGSSNDCPNNLPAMLVTADTASRVRWKAARCSCCGSRPTPITAANKDRYAYSRGSFEALFASGELVVAAEEPKGVALGEGKARFVRRETQQDSVVDSQMRSPQTPASDSPRTSNAPPQQQRALGADDTPCGPQLIGLTAEEAERRRSASPFAIFDMYESDDVDNFATDCADADDAMMEPHALSSRMPNNDYRSATFGHAAANEPSMMSTTQQHPIRVPLPMELDVATISHRSAA